MEVAYLTLFSIAFLAATILPLSSEVVLAGLSATSDEKILLLVVASFGNVLGSSFNWVLGKYTRNLETKKWFPFQPIKLRRLRFGLLNMVNGLCCLLGYLLLVTL